MNFHLLGCGKALSDAYASVMDIYFVMLATSLIMKIINYTLGDT